MAASSSARGASRLSRQRSATLTASARARARSPRVASACASAKRTWSPIALSSAAGRPNSWMSGSASPPCQAVTARAQARSSAGGTAGGGPAAAGVAAPRSAASASARRIAGSRVARRVNAMRWSAVRFEKIARAQSAGSSSPRRAPAIRQIIRSGRSIMPTVHSTPIDSARAFV